MATPEYLAPLNEFPPYPGEDLGGWTGANFIENRDTWDTYVWIVAMGAIFAFAMAWAIGANDVANSFATSVGSKTLKLWQAVIIAAIFEFVGAIALGGNVAKTIAGGITSPSNFQQEPQVFMYGMMCALAVAATTVTIATYFSYAISTTHSIIGAVLGFGLVYGGADAIIWNDKIDEFPFRKGVVTVFMSWFIAPISTAIVAAFVFFLTRFVVLRRANSTEWAFWSLPVLVLITVFISLFFVLYKGAGKELDWDDAGHKAAWVSAIVAGGAALLTIPVVFWLKRRMGKRFEREAAEAAQTQATAQDPVKKDEHAVSMSANGSVESTAPVSGNIFQRGWIGVKNHMRRSLTMDVHEDIYKDATVTALHNNAEVFHPHTEEVFKYLQVFSACCVSFAHGSNDVANAVGPFAGIWYVYNNFNVSSEAETPKWILALGGAGLVIGLATYGYNIIKVLGVAMAKMTPARGFSAELATSLVIALASVYGLPVSTTQCIVGAEIGVGIIDGGLRRVGFNWKLFGRTFLAWVIAFCFAALMSAALFSWGVYAPSVNDLDVVGNYQNAMSQAATSQLDVMNSTNLNTFAPAGAFDPALNASIAGLAQNLSSLNNFKKYGYTNQYDLMSVFKNTTALYLTETVPVYNVTSAATPAP